MHVEEIPKVSNLEIDSLVPTRPLPNIELRILSSKYDVLIKAIAYIDTYAQKTLTNPTILPS